MDAVDVGTRFSLSLASEAQHGAASPVADRQTAEHQGAVNREEGKKSSFTLL